MRRNGARTHGRTARAGRLLALCVCCVCASVRLSSAQCPDGTPPPCAAAVSQSRPAPNSVAVLTFENVTRDTSAQYLAEGLADQIATRLGGVARLTMISRSVVRRVRSPEQQSIQQLGRILNAAYLVNGAVRAASGRVRVNVEAVRAATGEAIWSEAYDRAGDDLIGIEEAVAIEVAAGVAGRLSPAERRALGGRVTTSSSAYEQYLRGNVLLARRTSASMQGAIVAYHAAAAADPGFADASARLAYAIALCVHWYNWDVDSLLALAREATARALRINPRSSDAWMGRAYTLNVWAENSPRADSDDSLLASLAAFRRAVELNPRNDEAWHQFGATLGAFSDSAGLNTLRRALALDPARAVTYVDLSMIYYRMGRLDRALETVDSALALDPDGPYRGVRAMFRLTAGDTAGALADARQYSYAAMLAAVARDSASIRQAEAAVAHPQFLCDPSLALYLLWTGRREQAVPFILRCGATLWTRANLRMPSLAPLAEDPRIQALLAQTERTLAKARWW
jgi:TolB-like protein/Tfp pilus assembly protein PilF